MLPNEEWLHTLCRGVGVDFAPRIHCQANYIELQGLLTLAPGEFYTSLMYMPSQLRVLFEYYHKPLDCFSVTVTERFILYAGQRLYLTSRNSRAGTHSSGLGAVVSISLARQYIEPGETITTDSRGTASNGMVMWVSDYLRGRSVPQDSWQLLPVLLLPKLVCTLLLQSEWGQVLLLSLWCRKWPWQRWPDPTWRAEHEGSHLSFGASNFAIDLEKMRTLVANIRQWAPAVLRDAAANDDDGGRVYDD